MGSQQMMGVEQEYLNLKTALELQANEHALAYQQRKAQERMISQQHDMHRTALKEQMKMMQGNCSQLQPQQAHLAPQPQLLFQQIGPAFVPSPHLVAAPPRYSGTSTPVMGGASV